MLNRKQPILELQAVSKCKKQKLNHERKADCIQLNTNIQFKNDLDDQYPQPQIQNQILIIPVTKDQSLPYRNRDFQDSTLTKHISQQLLVIKLMMLIMAILSIIMARIREDSHTLKIIGIDGDYVILAMHTLITIIIILMAIMKHIKTRQLTLMQLIRFSPYQLNIGGINSQFIFELIFLLVHPNLLSKGKILVFQEPIYQQYLNLSLNNFLQIFMLGRVYLIYSAIISSTIYLSTRGSRICRIYGTKCNLQFGLKCIFNSSPLFFLVVIFLSMTFVFGQMVRLSEDDVPSSMLGNFANSLWCVMITMGTVGYGDYYPQTYLTRVILFFAAITGIIIASLLILTLSTYLAMELSQNKAHITMHRLVLRNKVQQLAKGVMNKAAILSKLQPDKNEKQLKGLKKHTEDVKYTLRKIKNLIDTDNINEQMDRLFQCLQDNMKDAYINQTRYAQALKLMHEIEADKIKQMKFSFTQEIQNIIKDR